MPTTRNDMNVANVRCMFTGGEFHRGKTSTASAGGEAVPLPSTSGVVLLVLSRPGVIVSVFPSGGKLWEVEIGCISMAELAGAASVMVSVWVAMLLLVSTSLAVVDPRCARGKRLGSDKMDVEKTSVYIKPRQDLGGG